MAKTRRSRGCAKRPTEIPRTELPQGVRLALDRATTYLDASELLAHGAGLRAAAVLFSQGVEEFGKATMLKEALDTCAAPRATIVDFRSHQAKLTRAAQVLPNGWLALGGSFDADEYFDADTYFGESSAEEWVARLELLYADWDDSRREWKGWPQIDAKVLRKNIVNVRGFVNERRATWCPED